LLRAGRGRTPGLPDTDRAGPLDRLCLRTSRFAYLLPGIGPQSVDFGFALAPETVLANRAQPVIARHRDAHLIDKHAVRCNARRRGPATSAVYPRGHNARCLADRGHRTGIGDPAELDRNLEPFFRGQPARPETEQVPFPALSSSSAIVGSVLSRASWRSKRTDGRRSRPDYARQFAFGFPTRRRFTGAKKANGAKVVVLDLPPRHRLSSLSSAIRFPMD